VSYFVLSRPIRSRIGSRPVSPFHAYHLLSQQESTIGRQPACGMGITPTRKGTFLALTLACLACLFMPCAGGDMTSPDLAALENDKSLTPVQFVRCFADFKYELGDKVQEPAVFLQRKRGDCDDFASLAATLLTQRGYKTKIVVVMMGEQTHVVCYVKEAAGYLDFNHRKDTQPIMASDGSLEDLAAKVAADFRCAWRMASEIRYEGEKTVFIDNVFPLAGATAQPRNEKAARAVQKAASKAVANTSREVTSKSPNVPAPAVN
jgi:hypothetical protein